MAVLQLTRVKGDEQSARTPVVAQGALPDDVVMNDRTFLLLAENFCDWWMTKAMFHYRQTYDILSRSHDRF